MGVYYTEAHADRSGKAYEFRVALAKGAEVKLHVSCEVGSVGLLSYVSTALPAVSAYGMPGTDMAYAATPCPAMERLTRLSSYGKERAERSFHRPNGTAGRILLYVATPLPCDVRY
eukprot:1698852-Rhodomonas_salina.3